MTVPLLAIPILNRPDLLEACVASIDADVGRLLIIDNSPTGGMGDVAEANLLALEHGDAALDDAILFHLLDAAPAWGGRQADLKDDPHDQGDLGFLSQCDRLGKPCL